MNNKSFTADNQVTIVGGRNVGDEYLDATSAVAFVDLDVMAIGPVVRDVSSNFDRYWASDSAFPVDRLLPPSNVTARDELSSAATRILARDGELYWLGEVEGGGQHQRYDVEPGTTFWQRTAVQAISLLPIESLL